jgi:hypothetical protein
MIGALQAKEKPMPTFMGAFPVMEGKEDAVRKFAEEVLGRMEEFNASQARSGSTKEEWALQETPMGSLVLVRFEAKDPEAAFAALAQSTEPFDTWFKSRVLEISGVDLGAAPDGPPPEIILDWTT